MCFSPPLLSVVGFSSCCGGTCDHSSVWWLMFVFGLGFRSPRLVCVKGIGGSDRSEFEKAHRCLWVLPVDCFVWRVEGSIDLSRSFLPATTCYLGSLLH
ncbi:hypothetical protein DY000_02020141 [Brassica cretica]|uniref:Secreted protein n=1 Tax=Brassica cretica TaxID=69181 RepID=A0ABQ7EFL3_BRACR|nr:hypothetical protein DY000_02020141 [Brassica cretica]